jgi:hypothetical protein
MDGDRLHVGTSGGHPGHRLGRQPVRHEAAGKGFGAAIPAGSLLCALEPSIPLLVAFRAVV